MYRECIKLGGEDTNLGALSSLPSSTSDSSIFIGVALSVLTCFAQLISKPPLANGVPTHICVANGHTGLIGRFFFGTLGVISSCMSGCKGFSPSSSNDT